MAIGTARVSGLSKLCDLHDVIYCRYAWLDALTNRKPALVLPTCKKSPCIDCTALVLDSGTHDLVFVIALFWRGATVIASRLCSENPRQDFAFY
ncbi:MAG: hypothetical protein RL180_288 [Pseudomonadota bacterium]